MACTSLQTSWNIIVTSVLLSQIYNAANYVFKQHQKKSRIVADGVLGENFAEVML